MVAPSRRSVQRALPLYAPPPCTCGHPTIFHVDSTCYGTVIVVERDGEERFCTLEGLLPADLVIRHDLCPCPTFDPDAR